MTSIDRLREQLDLQAHTLTATGEAIQQLTELVDQEKQYTQRLIEKTQPKPQVEAVAPKEPTPSKAEVIAKMSDDQLLSALENPKKALELFRGL